MNFKFRHSLKRIFDVLFSLIALIMLLPALLVISILIRATTQGPVFFIQPRVGRNGKIFMLYKFRSMKTTEFSEQGNFEPGNIARITKLGKTLRKTKLDELPQLLNVLKGDMSIVGPRPEVEKWVKIYPERWKYIHSVRPGITDMSSIEFRNEEFILEKSDDPEKTYKEVILPKKLDFYENYISSYSFFGDLKLMFKTVFFIIFKS